MSRAFTCPKCGQPHKEITVPSASFGVFVSNAVAERLAYRPESFLDRFGWSDAAEDMLPEAVRCSECRLDRPVARRGGEMKTIASHSCEILAELGLVCEYVELDGGTLQPPDYTHYARQWRLHVVSAGKRVLISLIINFCPFCGERLEETLRLPPTGVVLS